MVYWKKGWCCQTQTDEKVKDMLYETRTISTREEISQCPFFEVGHFLWSCRRRPETFGRMGYIKNKGLFLQMTSLESGPLRELKNHRDMVCKDSAVEAFFSFQTAQPDESSLYFNFEVNANGAMYAKYGHGRKNRLFLTDDEYTLTGVTATVEPDRWSAELLVPNQVLERVCGISGFEAGDTFFCNFYKISENPEIEHYAAYNPILSETPNFHLPQFFAKAVVV
jgi:hypothetical protein